LRVQQGAGQCRLLTELSTCDDEDGCQMDHKR
jgi:hypothetical protein